MDIYDPGITPVLFKKMARYERVYLPDDSREIGAMEMDTSNQPQEKTFLTWADGQPLVTDAPATKLSLSTTVITRLEQLTDQRRGSETSGSRSSSLINGRSGHKKVEDTEYKESTVTPKRFWLVSIGVLFGLFLAMLDTGIVATSLYTISLHFDDFQRVNWVALAYTLTYLGFAVTVPRISDVIGRRSTFTGCYVLFIAFSLACGWSQSLTQLIAFRALQGTAGSGLYSLTMVIMGELCPPKLQPAMSSAIGLTVAGSGVLGPVLGGILTEHTSWRWIFWINGPIGCVSLSVFLLAWPPADQLPRTPRKTWRQFDYLGAFLIVAGTVLVIFAFQNAGEHGPMTFKKPVFIIPLIAGMLCLIALLVWEFSVEVVFKNLSPAFPISLFRNKAYLCAALGTMLLGFPYLMTIFSFPIRLQIVSGKSPMMAGIMLLPMLGSLAAGAIISSRASKAKNYTWESQIIAAVTMLIGAALMTIVDGEEDDAMALGFLVFLGFGYGMQGGAASWLTLVESSIKDYAPAQGIIAQARIFGGSFGIAASTAMMDNRRRQYLEGVLTPEQLQHLGASAGRLTREQAFAVKQSSIEAYRDGMIACAVIAGVAIPIALAAYRGGPRKIIAEQQEQLVLEENKRRCVRPDHDAWEIEALNWRSSRPAPAPSMTY